MKKWLLTVKALILCFAMVIAQGCGQSGELPKFNGVNGPLFNVVDGQILITFEFLNMQVDAGLKAPIPKTKRSYLEFAPNALNGGMIFQMYLDVEDLKEISVGVGDGNYLPDGRPVPGIPGGRLENSLRIDTSWHDVSFFYHQTLFGVWIPVGWDTAGISGYWNVVMNQKRVGFIGLVGNDPVKDYKAGAVLLLNIDALKDQKLQQLLKMSKRNPGVVY